MFWYRGRQKPNNVVARVLEIVDEYRTPESRRIERYIDASGPLSKYVDRIAGQEIAYQIGQELNVNLEEIDLSESVEQFASKVAKRVGKPKAINI